jgi:hypothetical protein
MEWQGRNGNEVGIIVAKHLVNKKVYGQYTNSRMIETSVFTAGELMDVVQVYASQAHCDEDIEAKKCRRRM